MRAVVALWDHAPMGRRINITLDCRDAATLAAFWAAALGYEDGGRHEEFWPLFPRDESEPMIVLQEVAEAKAGKNRMHLDVHVDDLDAEVARLEALGGRRLTDAPVVGHGHTWWVMVDPEGNELCVVRRPTG